MSTDAGNQQPSQTEDAARVTDLLRASLREASDVFDLCARLKPAVNTIMTIDALLQACETLQTEQGIENTPKDVQDTMKDLAYYGSKRLTEEDASTFFYGMKDVSDMTRAWGCLQMAAACTFETPAMVRNLRRKENRDTLRSYIDCLDELCYTMHSHWKEEKPSQAKWFKALADHLDCFTDEAEQFAALDMFLDEEGRIPVSC